MILSPDLNPVRTLNSSDGTIIFLRIVPSPPFVPRCHPSEAWMVGDTRCDLLAARAAGGEPNRGKKSAMENPTLMKSAV